MMSTNLKKEILKCIDMSKQAAKNNLDITIESYMEIIGRLDFLTYLLLTDEKKIVWIHNENFLFLENYGIIKSKKTFNAQNCKFGNFFIKITS